MKGKVYLVGAGPGDPELLTLKAARVLKNAEAVLHDDLVSPQILNFAPPDAQRYNVGKRCGKTNVTQAEINFLMVRLASLGLRVVRLKGGDPLVFGRAAEEITALREAGIEFEIVPGITAALGACAAAEIPLTDRRSSHALIFLAGHHAVEHAVENDPTNWQALVSSGATLVIYMPGYQYEEITRKLGAAGLASETPCAVVSRATTAEEQLFTTDLQNLTAAPQLPAPTLLVIGEVVRQAAQDTSLKQSISVNPDLLYQNFAVESVQSLIDEGRTV
jgi:uroporphyrin-III C-methyltransferase